MARRTELQYADSYRTMKFVIDAMPEYTDDQAKAVEEMSQSDIERAAFGALRRAKEWMRRHAPTKTSEDECSTVE